MPGHEDDVSSEAGGEDVFRRGAAAYANAGASGNVGGFTRSVESKGVGWGRGPIGVDKRKYRFDVNAAATRPPVPFSSTRVDRMDAVEAGDMLHAIHVMYGLDTQPEERLLAFNNALWYEHAVNGASTLQSGRGKLYVGEMAFDIAPITKKLGVDARRFFRAYADDVAVCLRGVLKEFDPYSESLSEMQAIIMQVAVTRGLQKYPHLIHDSSDAAVGLSIEERAALQASKRVVIASTVNNADAIVERVGQSAG